MKSEWQPGDVAMVTLPGGERAIGVRPLRNDGWNHSGAFAGGADYDHIGETDARPLVVIDPEDREQVERLRGIVDGSDGPGFSNDLELWQAALREFANPTPPKPDEPTGLGAVVVDHREMMFVRCADGWLFAAGGAHEPGEYRNVLTWADLRGVRILSPGWSE